MRGNTGVGGIQTPRECREVLFIQLLHLLGYLSDLVFWQVCQLFAGCGDCWGGGREKKPHSSGYGCFTLWRTVLLRKMGKRMTGCVKIKVCLHWSVKQDLGAGLSTLPPSLQFTVPHCPRCCFGSDTPKQCLGLVALHICSLDMAIRCSGG